MSTLTKIRPATTIDVDPFDAAFDRLVLAWEEYETLRSCGASFGALVEARAALQRARIEAASARRPV
jgi:ribosomal protein S12 methylthiotransferase accessory factor YcaO